MKIIVWLEIIIFFVLVVVPVLYTVQFPIDMDNEFSYLHNNAVNIIIANFTLLIAVFAAKSAEKSAKATQKAYEYQIQSTKSDLFYTINQLVMLYFKLIEIYTLRKKKKIDLNISNNLNKDNIFDEKDRVFFNELFPPLFKENMTELLTIISLWKIVSDKDNDVVIKIANEYIGGFSIFHALYSFFIYIKKEEKISDYEIIDEVLKMRLYAKDNNEQLEVFKRKIKEISFIRDNFLYVWNSENVKQKKLKILFVNQLSKKKLNDEDEKKRQFLIENYKKDSIRYLFELILKNELDFKKINILNDEKKYSEIL